MKSSFFSKDMPREDCDSMEELLQSIKTLVYPPNKEPDSTSRREKNSYADPSLLENSLYPKGLEFHEAFSKTMPQETNSQSLMDKKSPIQNNQKESEEYPALNQSVRALLQAHQKERKGMSLEKHLNDSILDGVKRALEASPGFLDLCIQELITPYLLQELRRWMDENLPSFIAIHLQQLQLEAEKNNSR